MDRFATSEIKVTYYLGAGASAQALPTVKPTATSDGLSRALNIIAGQLENSKELIDASYEVQLEKQIFNLRELSHYSNKFGTLDTYAKFLFLKKDSRLNDLKETLSFYFTIEQLINKKLDDRALIFITTVLENANIFPSNINILSWNYDFQIQIASETYDKESFIHKEGVTSHHASLIPYFPKLGYEFTVNSNDLKMVYLNGIAGFFNMQKDVSSLNLNHFTNEPPTTLNDLFDRWYKDSNIKTNLLNFAWENAQGSNSALIHANNLVNETDILVVIGYSFPYFNRNIDKIIFKSMTDGGRLKKIYFQDPYLSGDFLYNQFNLDKDKIVIEHITRIDNYHVPMEL